MGTYVVYYADSLGDHEMQFLWQKTKAKSYFSKLKNCPKLPVHWAAILRVYDPDGEEVDCLGYFYTDDKYAHLFEGYEITD